MEGVKISLIMPEEDSILNSDPPSLSNDRSNILQRNRISSNRNFNDTEFSHSLKDVTFMLPAYNEEKAIGNLINRFKRYDNSNVLVVDNNSRDKTVQIARSAGANVIYEHKQGKGNAVRKGFTHIKSNYTVMLDADDTYDPVDAEKLLKPLMEGKADVVLGSRLRGKRDKGAISSFNLVGNHLLSLCASLLHSRVSDVCTGYWAFNKNAVKHLLNKGIESDGFEIEAEMFSKISNSDLRVLEVPIHYKRRSDETKLNSVMDGGKIFINLIGSWFKQKIERITTPKGSFKSNKKLPSLYPNKNLKKPPKI